SCATGWSTNGYPCGNAHEIRVRPSTSSTSSVASGTGERYHRCTGARGRSPCHLRAALISSVLGDALQIGGQEIQEGAVAMLAFGVQAADPGKLGFGELEVLVGHQAPHAGVLCHRVRHDERYCISGASSGSR